MKRFQTLVVVMMACSLGYAQPNQLNAQFYQHPYLLNPAMAAIDPGWSFFLGYSHQLDRIKDAGHTQALTASFRTGNTGLAVAGFQDRQGLLSRTRLLGTYAYHIQLDEAEGALHFGVSLGIQREQIDVSDIRGNTGDPVVGEFNEQRNYLDGGAGIAYTDTHWNLQVAVPELGNQLNGNRNHKPGTATFLVAGGYRFYVGKDVADFTIEPRVYYRAFSGMPGVVDGGVSVSLKNKFTLDGLYHSSDRFTGGFSAAISPSLTGMLLYSNGVSAMNFFGERLELGVRYRLRN
ncbi:MAG: type IX secretion system membrane protein PorP/SprF [Parapedobacter sp.]|nr:MAG: type IX secretion system membrane protein PorP/SprF [Parapedobacter sp.]